MELTFRTEVTPEDIKNVREIVESTGFFYEHETDIAVELVEERLRNGEESGYNFIFAEIEGRPVAYSCFGLNPMTKSCFDLYWIVAHNSYRGKGIGKKLLEETHKESKKMGGTMIIAETSGRDKYLPTREFYTRAGYRLEAVIKDFYDKDDDKCIYIMRF